MALQEHVELKQEIAGLRQEILNLKEEILGSISYAKQKAKTLEPDQDASDSPASTDLSPPLRRSDAGGVPYEKVRSALLELAAVKGRSIALEVLQGFGVTTAKDLTPDQYSDCYLTIKDASL